MNLELPAETRKTARAGVSTWRSPAMAIVVCLLYGPIFATPLVALVWAAGGVLHLSPLLLEIGEIAALAAAAAPTAWLARRGWRAEARMAAGLDP